MSETEQKKKPTKPETQKEEGEDLSPPSPLPTPTESRRIEEKKKPPKQRVEIVDSSKKTETGTEEIEVTMYKYTKCPYEDCGAEQIYHDPKLGVYYCSECHRSWQ